MDRMRINIIHIEKHILKIKNIRISPFHLALLSSLCFFHITIELCRRSTVVPLLPKAELRPHSMLTPCLVPLGFSNAAPKVVQHLINSEFQKARHKWAPYKKTVYKQNQNLYNVYNFVQIIK